MLIFISMKIQQLYLLSENLNETENFYAGVLGLRIKVKTADSISFQIGHSTLTFLKTDTEKPVYHFAFDIPNNRLQEAVSWIGSKTEITQFENEDIIDFPNWNAKSVYFFDNNGNVLEFIARFELSNESGTAFGSSGILSISEVAFVTENVPALADRLISENGFSYFEKQVPRNDFSVLGKDGCLIILVSSERNWFPTQIKAESFWMKATIESNQNLIELQHP